jgi:hypothetical protein
MDCRQALGLRCPAEPTCVKNPWRKRALIRRPTLLLQIVAARVCSRSSVFPAAGARCGPNGPYRGTFRASSPAGEGTKEGTFGRFGPGRWRCRLLT